MFNMKIESLEQFAGFNTILPNVNSMAFQGDISMVVTLRALLFGRVDNDYSFSVIVSNKDAAAFQQSSTKGTKNAFLGRQVSLDTQNHIHFINLTNSPNNAKKSIAFFNENFEAYAKGKKHEFKTQSDIAQYLKAKIDLESAFFVCEETNSAIIVVEDMTMRTWHLLQSFIPRYLPAIFREHPLTETDAAVLRSMTGRTSTSFIQAIGTISDRPEIRAIILKDALENFERQQRKCAYDNAQQQFERIEREVAELLERYRNKLDLREAAIIQLEGTKALMDKAEVNHELYNYFVSRQNIDLIETQGSHIKFIIDTFLDVYDPEVWARFSKVGDIFRNYNLRGKVFEKEADRKLLLDSIFSDNPELRIHMCAYFNLDLRGSSDSLSYYDFGAKYANSIPNPHLNRHNCLGNYRGAIDQCLQEGNLTGAIEQCAASAMSVNLGETSMTFRPMVEELLNHTGKCLRRADGVDLTPEEALAWLKTKGE